MSNSPESGNEVGAAGLYAAIALLIWAAAFLAFPRFVSNGMIPAVAWIFDSIGFISFLIGVMGLCIETGKRKGKKGVSEDAQ